MGKLLSQLSDRLEEEVNKYHQIQKAVEVKETELQEIYEIQKSASSLAALIEVQHQKREEFEAEMAARKEELQREIQTLRAEWDQEKKRHDAEIKERDAAEAKKREREKEEYHYAFQREQQVAKDQFQDEKAKLEREIQYKREEMEKELAEREKVVAQQEAELNELREKVGAFPKQLETAVNKAVKEAVERVQLEAKNKEELLKKEFEGERNVLNTRIGSLEKTVKKQAEQLARLAQQAEKAYGQVQDIAVKAIEGSSHFQSFASLQQLVAEQTRKPSPEK
jgi:chromosome segregation ATPase